ncbi:hypothetical protein FEM48_Zijuj03G0158800 [Ziziphus jujuba var. spinosa]|uniref:GAG-pre-integrase domain-containing protein n=1 Tax=Ziziphus jujuba var. spinosa TaxID=714518 RepID=A0A978VR82_ZIZJJ|nr:hypothetical protein FEM48_Zijuj03G0158800 [Ziziphus jujuba var. spinosa]
MFQNSPMSSGVNAHFTQLYRPGFVNPALFNFGSQGQYPVGVFGNIMTPYVNHASGGGQFGSGLSLSNAGVIHSDGVASTNTRDRDSVCSSGVECLDFGCKKLITCSGYDSLLVLPVKDSLSFHVANNDSLDFDVLHQRLGHASVGVVNKVLSLYKTGMNIDKELSFCEACQYGKGHLLLYFDQPWEFLVP